MENQRYSRQIIYENIGEEGQKKLLNSSIAIIGLGALGTVSANNLTRAGVGNIKLIDRDYVEISNLQRQTLYDEEDAFSEKPKAIAAYEHLSKVNSLIHLKPVISDVNASNIAQLISGCDLVLDCTDNFEVRLTINEACDKLKIPWIYCGAIGSSMMTFNILPGVTPCFLCLTGGHKSTESHETCATVGVLNMTTNIASSIQSAEALKILLSSQDIRETLFYMDVWNSSTEYLVINKNPDCPVCTHHQYEYLDKPIHSYTTSLCGRNEIQIIPEKESRADLSGIANTLKNLGEVSCNNYMLNYTDGKIGIKLFNNGRAIIKNAKDANHAKSIYTEYIGL